MSDKENLKNDVKEIQLYLEVVCLLKNILTFLVTLSNEYEPYDIEHLKIQIKNVIKSLKINDDNENLITLLNNNFSLLSDLLENGNIDLAEYRSEFFKLMKKIMGQLVFNVNI